jgi:ferrous iron transport protein A
MPVEEAAGRVMPLTMVRIGQTARVCAIRGRDEVRRLLGSLGFVEDAEVSVVCELNGNLIVSVKGTRLAISKAMASRILAAEFDKGDDLE